MESDSSSGDTDEVFEGKPFWEETRCEPVGAAREDDPNEISEDKNRSADRIQALEEEHEILSTSVFSLTSHLAQVEFRLRQIIKATPEEKDEMLKALEQFTSRGIPDPKAHSNNDICMECEKLDDKMRKQRVKQTQFIEQLKVQLKELEQFTSRGGFENHRSLISDLKEHLDQNIKENSCQTLTGDEISHQINCALRQYASNQMSKEEVVGKLQKHIEEMQNFIKIMNTDKKENISETKSQQKASTSQSYTSTKDDLRTETANLMRKASALIQIFTVSQFGCSPRPHQPYQSKSSVAVDHWGNLRAGLEMSIEAVLNLVSRRNNNMSGIESYDSDSEDNSVVLNNVPLTTAVRKHLAINIRDLLQHGMISPNETNSLVPFIGCFPMRRNSTSNRMHIWELIIKYYNINNGDCFNSTPARRLSQSFNLDIVGGTAVSNKQMLLSAIDNVVASHTPYKRSHDAHFKAFICLALNSQKLVVWLNLILKCKSLVQTYYSSISYVINTGFQDSLHSLDRLTPYKFDLPVDLAVKQFQNIKDVF